jgi:hypothetical protein
MSKYRVKSRIPERIEKQLPLGGIHRLNDVDCKYYWIDQLIGEGKTLTWIDGGFSPYLDGTLIKNADYVIDLETMRWVKCSP